MNPSATIDGLPVELRAGDTILDAACRLGIDVPTLCHQPKLALEGNCRVCLVEVEGEERPHAACHTPVTAGMSVRTASARLYQLRRDILGLILGEHAEGRFAANERGTEFEGLLQRFDVRRSPFGHHRRAAAIDDSVSRLTVSACRDRASSPD